MPKKKIKAGKKAGKKRMPSKDSQLDQIEFLLRDVLRELIDANRALSNLSSLDESVSNLLAIAESKDSSS
jgi:hypothetical protein